MSQFPRPEAGPASFLQQQKPWHLDVLILVVLMVINPLLWGYRLESGLTPDAIGYLTFAEHILATGQLFLPGWGHADTALLPSPFYPLLIALANQFGGDIVTNATNVNVTCLLLATVPLYLMVRTLAGPWIAAGVVILTHANLNYLFFGSAIYSEASFMLAMLVTLLLVQQATANERAGTVQLLAIGAFSALAFLSRHIGIVLIIFVVGWMIAVPAIRREGWKRTVRYVLLLAAGWLALAGPYVAALYVQVHESPLKQTFRLGQYQVATADPAILSAIAQNDAMPSDSYPDLYRKRRLQRQLLADASEMHAYVIRDRNALNSSPAVEMFVSKLTKPGEVIRDLVGNVRHLVSLLGIPVLILFVVAGFSALTVRSPVGSRQTRMLLPVFVGTYVLILSLMTAQIERYLAVLLPLISVHIAIELGVFVNLWKRRFPGSLLLPAVLMIGFTAALLTAPYTLLNSSMLPPSGGSQRLVTSKMIPDREPVFALLPFYSYIAGGSYRILPNDTLPKVIRYGQRTGVRWLMVPATAGRALSGEISLYTHARWLMTPDRLRNCRGQLKLHGILKVATEEHLVFEILPQDERRKSVATAACDNGK